MLHNVGATSAQRRTPRARTVDFTPARAPAHLKRVFRRDVKVPATNEATNNPAGRAASSCGRPALAHPCRTP
ncbi:hypothetical protein C6Q22_26615 [Burkholderia multivorans]|nr:hypothetical protein C6P79_30870 [Burkholderia multivorans]PRE24085.1 hypothetical protein C6P92_09425 [Burkholderia multivorans]PRE69772.1 hypothetical protein C6P86_08955 [Burkholderia multivorans]PRE83444.1 hypothetical protein C6Q00_16850 [Burkholderia multivorans]PRF31926.1 hypothetical protein C6Q08_16465 [Burkholderia multivorans]